MGVRVKAPAYDREEAAAFIPRYPRRGSRALTFPDHVTALPERYQPAGQREAGQPRNHAASASVRTRRATLRADAGNQANSRQAPSRDCAERARMPRRRAALARAPMGRQRVWGAGAPSPSPRSGRARESCRAGSSIRRGGARSPDRAGWPNPDRRCATTRGRPVTSRAGAPRSGVRLVEPEHVTARGQHRAGIAPPQQLHQGHATERRNRPPHHRRNTVTLEMADEQIGGGRQIRNRAGALRRHAAPAPLADRLTAHTEEVSSRSCNARSPWPYRSQVHPDVAVTASCHVGAELPDLET